MKSMKRYGASLQLTLTAISAIAGDSESARGRIEEALAKGDILDAQVRTLGEGLWMLFTHTQGERSPSIHQLAWEAIEIGAPEALATKDFPGQLDGSGISCCELSIYERPHESLIAFAGVSTATGSFNLPLYRIFADPFNTPGLILSESLGKGSLFEVHDSLEQRKAIFTLPEELYGMLAHIGSPGRFVVHRVIPRATNNSAAVASIDRLLELPGMAGHQHPLAIVRCDGGLPTVGEAIEPFAVPSLVEGFARASHLGPWMPVALTDASPARFDGPPRVVSLNIEVSLGKLHDSRDLFDDPSFDGAREEANRLADIMRSHGPFEPHRLPFTDDELDELPPPTAHDSSRWVDT